MRPFMSEPKSLHRKNRQSTKIQKGEKKKKKKKKDATNTIILIIYCFRLQACISQGRLMIEG